MATDKPGRFQELDEGGKRILVKDAVITLYGAEVQNSVGLGVYFSVNKRNGVHFLRVLSSWEKNGLEAIHRKLRRKFGFGHFEACVLPGDGSIVLVLGTAPVVISRFVHDMREPPLPGNPYGILRAAASIQRSRTKLHMSVTGKMEKLLLCILLILLGAEASADTWLPPRIKDYYSRDSTFCVRIYPQHVPEKYFDWLRASPSEKRRFLPGDTLVTSCYAQLYKTTMNGDTLIWEQQLINQIAPVSAVVSDNGKYVVTFDNWHSMGYGLDVMVYYNETGHLIKRHMLEDISPFPINTYDKSVSSLWWRCGQKFIDSERMLICFRDRKGKMEERIYDLEKGRIVASQ